MKNITRREMLAIGAALALAGCGGNSGEDSPAEEKPAEGSAEVAEETAVDTPADTLDFDGTGHEEAGDLTFYLATPGGTTEDGNVPQILVDPDTFGYGVDVCVFDGDGTVCAVYIDGHLRGKLNAGDTQQPFDLEESDMTEGVHKVELVSDSDGGASIYKVAEYEIVLA